MTINKQLPTGPNSIASLYHSHPNKNIRRILITFLFVASLTRVLMMFSLPLKALLFLVASGIFVFFGTLWNTLPILIGLILFVFGIIWLMWSLTRPYKESRDEYWRLVKKNNRKNEIYSIFFIITGAIWFIISWNGAHQSPPNTMIDNSTSCLNRGGVESRDEIHQEGHPEYTVNYVVCNDGFTFTTI